MTRRPITADHAIAPLALVAVAAAASMTTRPAALQAATAAPAPPEPRQLEITAIVRDFADLNHPNGHPDFQAWSGTMRFGLIEPFLGADGKPVMRSRTGLHVQRPFIRSGREINPFPPRVVAGEDGSMYDADRLSSLAAENPDAQEGILVPVLDERDARLTSEARFNQWYRDISGVNISFAVPLVLDETGSDTGRFVFDSSGQFSHASNPWLADLPIHGFFPINGRGFGNFQGHDNGSTNDHFTTEIITTFTCLEDSGYTFGFSGDDDVWVFIDGRLVIDMGSLHSRLAQWVDLDDLTWLEHGEEYTLHVFHAERRTGQSNLRIETTIPLKAYTALGVHNAFD